VIEMYLIEFEEMSRNRISILDACVCQDFLFGRRFLFFYYLFHNRNHHHHNLGCVWFCGKII